MSAELAGLVQASGKAKAKMAAAVVADSDAELEPSESEFEPDVEMQAETEVCASCSTASGICIIPVHCLHDLLLELWTHATARLLLLWLASAGSISLGDFSILNAM